MHGRSLPPNITQCGIPFCFSHVLTQDPPHKTEMTITAIHRGDILVSKERCIAHQCNCVTVQSKGFAASLFERFPDENVYVRRGWKKTDVPGTIACTGRLIHLFAQWAPGKPGAYVSFYRSRPNADMVKRNDDATEREGWFSACLSELAHVVKDDELVAIPMGIGCNMAGGDWPRYETMLKDAKTRFVVYFQNEPTPAVEQLMSFVQQQHDKSLCGEKRPRIGDGGEQRAEDWVVMCVVKCDFYHIRSAFLRSSAPVDVERIFEQGLDAGNNTVSIMHTCIGNMDDDLIEKVDKWGKQHTKEKVPNGARVHVWTLIDDKKK